LKFVKKAFSPNKPEKITIIGSVMNRNKSLDSGVPPIFQFDNDIREHYPVIAGIDEAGRGPLAGPVVAAAVVLPPDFKDPMLNDSKKLTKRKRIYLRDKIIETAVDYGIGIINNNTRNKERPLMDSSYTSRDGYTGVHR